MKPPLVIDLFCGLGGWTDGFLAEGWDCIGFDITRHDYGKGGYPGQLVIQDALTLHGSQFRHADAIVASPPCQEFSYMAMPWSRAKQIAGGLREEVPFPEGYTGSRTLAELTALFDACFRLQREACAAAGRHIPMVVENVKGAQPWVGKARANFGSFYLWGDVDSVGGRIVAGRPQFGVTVQAARRGSKGKTNLHVWENSGGAVSSPSWHGAEHEASVTAVLQSEGVKQRGSGAAWFDTGIAALPSGSRGRKHGGDCFNDPSWPEKQGGSGRKVGDGFGWSKESPLRNNNSKSDSRRAASAEIAKIPLPLSQYIAQCFDPRRNA